MIWLFQFAKTGRIKTLGEAMKAFQKLNGRPPSLKEIKTMENIMREATGKTADVIQFPKDRITDPFKPRPGEGLASIKEQAQDLKTFGKEVIDDLNAPIKPDLTVVSKPPKGKINYPEIEKKFGFPLRGNESLSELAKIEKMGRDEYYNSLANRAMSIRTRMSRVDAEGGTEIGYQEFNKLQKELDGLNDFITRVQKEIPEDMASGGIAREGYLKGKVVKGIKSLLKPKKTRKLTKDELDDLYEEFDEAVPYPMETVGDKEKFLKAVKDEEAYMFQQYKKGNLDPKPGEPNRKRFLEKKLEEMELSGDKRLMTREEIEELSSFDLGTEMDEAVKKYKQKDIQQKRDLQAFDVKDRTKQASGGIAGQLHLNEGGRVPMIFGGSAGLRGLWKKMLEHISKGKDKPIKKFFPKMSAEERAMEKMVMGTPEQKAFRAREKDLKIEGIDLLINRLKNDKKILERQAKNKAMKDPNLDFLTKHMEKSMPEVYGPHLKKYTDIDKDILQLETIKKNLIMKDRKLNAEGGRVSYTKGGLAHVLGV